MGTPGPCQQENAGLVNFMQPGDMVVARGARAISKAQILKAQLFHDWTFGLLPSYVPVDILVDAERSCLE